MSDPDNIEALADKIRRGDKLSAEETLAIFKTADQAGMLYYKLLTMVREQRSLKELPETLKKVIATGAWKSWRWVGSEFHQNSLGSYLTSPPPNGVGIQLDTVEKLIVGDEDAETAYRREMVAEKGTNQHAKEGHDNVMIQGRQGNSRTYTLKRLKDEFPELFERVKAKELSANAAAIEAGFRKKATPFETILKLLPKLRDAEICDLQDVIERYLNR